jgi:SNF2 family DNA or RNA helicase
MSEIKLDNKDSIYFLYIPTKNGEFRLHNKQNYFTIIKVTKVLFEENTDNDNDYYTLSDETCQINALNRKCEDSTFNETLYSFNKIKYIIEYIFLSSADIKFILKKIKKESFIRFFINKLTSQYKINQNLVFTKDIKYQNVLNQMYEFVMPSNINNTFSFNTEKYKSNNLSEIIIGEAENVYAYTVKIYYIKSFYISDFDFYDKNIVISRKYNYLCSLFNLSNGNLYTGSTKLNYLTNNNIYNCFNISKNKNFIKLNFIISNILNTNNKNIKYYINYELDTRTPQRYNFTHHYSFKKINLKIKVLIKKDYMDDFIKNNKVMNLTWVNFFNENFDKETHLKFVDYYYYLYHIKNNKIKNIKNINLDKILNIKPFKYQYENVKWMNYVENLKDKKYKFKYLGNIDFNYLNFNAIPNTNLIYKENKIYDLNNKDLLETYKMNYHINGGILTDEVGLGKTLSSFLFILSKLEKDKKKIYEFNNLIITPNRLVQQWYSEMKRYINEKELKITIFKIFSITDIKKNLYNIKNKKYDIIIISSNLLTNTNYISYVEKDDYQLKEYVKSIKKMKANTIKEYHQSVLNCENVDDILKINTYEVKKELDKYKIDKTLKFNIFKIKWNRIFVDESHEIIKGKFSPNYLFGTTVPYNIKRTSYIKKDDIYKFFQLMKLNSNYKWCLSATPFKDKVINLIGYSLFLNSDIIMDSELKFSITEYDRCFKEVENIIFSFSENELETLFSTFMRKNKKKELQDEINIPIFTEEVKLLTQNNIERNLYLEESRNNNSLRLLQLCTHIMVGNELIDFNNFNFNVMNLDKIRELNLSKYKKLLIKNTKEIQNNELKKKENERKVELITVLLETLKTKDFNTITSERKGYINNYLRNIRRNYGYNYGYSYGHSYNYTEILKNLKDMILTDDFIINFSSHYDDVKNTFVDMEFNEIDLLQEKLFLIYKLYQTENDSYKAKFKLNVENEKKFENETRRLDNQIKLFSNSNFIKESMNDPCGICFESYKEEDKIGLTICRHFMCESCIKMLFGRNTQTNCPFCRTRLSKKDINFICCNSEEKKEPKLEISDKVKKYGTKLSYLIDYLNELFKVEDNRIIIFSQYDSMLKLIGKVLDDFKIKNLFVKGNIMSVTKNIEKFKSDKSYKIIMLSSERSSSGNNLTEASHIIFVDTVNGDKKKVKDLESQAIGRAVRLGQKKPVKLTRLIMKNTIEETLYNDTKYDIADLQ